MLGLTLNNSPFYLAGLLVLLVVIWIIKKPLFSIFSKSKKWVKKKIQKKHKSIVNEVLPKKKKKESKSKFIHDWATPLFYVIGLGFILYSLFGNLRFFTDKIIYLQEFIFSFTNHNNLTTIILSVFISSLLVIVVDLFEWVQTRKTKIFRIMSIFLFSILISGIFIIFLDLISLSRFSLINSIIFGVVFIIMGTLFNFKRIFFSEEKVEKSEEFVF